MESMANTAVLLSGSNMGDRLHHLQTAKEQLPAHGCLLEAESAIYQTSAWGNPDLPAFLNQAWKISTAMEPTDLLQALLDIEKSMGRKRNLKWESRIIDLDILFFNDLVFKSDNLIIPHPHVHERKFALLPVAEILPDWEHPVFHKTISTLLDEVMDPLGVTKFAME